MVTPVTRNFFPMPSYAAGFATGPHDSLAPWFWDKLVLLYAPILGVTGRTLIDHGPYKTHGIFDSGESMTGDNWKVGKHGIELEFNEGGDSNEFLQSGQVSPQAVNGPVSVSALFYATGDPADGSEGRIIAKSNGGGSFDYGLFTGYDTGASPSRFHAFGIRTGGGSTELTGGEIVLNTWYFDVGTWNSVTQEHLLYSQGVQIANGSKSGNLTDGAAGFIMGAATSFSGFSFRGRCPICYVHRRVLTPVEILVLNRDPFLPLRKRGGVVALSPAAALAWTERQQRSSVAISHYPMTPSLYPDGAWANEDLAVAGYGFYMDWEVAAGTKYYVIT